MLGRGLMRAVQMCNPPCCHAAGSGYGTVLWLLFLNLGDFPEDWGKLAFRGIWVSPFDFWRMCCCGRKQKWVLGKKCRAHAVPWFTTLSARAPTKY